jgi:putative glycosyltransferase (TIGR04372 family)
VLSFASLPVIKALNSVIRFFCSGRVLRITIMDPRLFGHQSLEPEVFWNDWQTAVEQGSRDFWFCCLGKKSSASNPHLWRLRKQKLPTLPSWFVTSIVRWGRRFNFSHIKLMDPSITRLEFLTSRGLILPQPTTMKNRREEVLARLAEPERPYVVLTVREYDFKSAENELRNRPINDFVPTIQTLVELGYNVIRLTSRTGDPLVLESEHVIDWQVRETGQSGDELAIISGASFVVSTTTGGDCLALAYRKPVLYVDSARLFYVFLATELATFQMPLFVDESTGSRLNLAQLLERGLGWVGEQRAFAAAGVTVINSTPEQIRDYVREYHQLKLWQINVADSQDEVPWREMILSHHGGQVRERFGSIRARMHPSSKREMLSGG